MYRRLSGTVAAELVSRGLLWARVLLLGALMPVDGYGYVLVLLGIEGLLTAILSYPSIKDILVRQHLSLEEFRRFSLSFLLVVLPVTAILVGLAGYGWAVAGIVLLAAFVAASTQIGLYMLRVADLSIHNRVKLAWAVVTTILFLGLLPLHWAFLPLVYGAGILPVLWGVVRTIRTTKISAAFEADAGYHVRGAIIYGTQALINNFPQHGARLFVAATMTLSDVALYTQTYMLATALFFVYSTVMIMFEPRLSRAGSAGELRQRLPLAVRLSLAFIVLAAVHMVAMRFFLEAGLFSAMLSREIPFDSLLFLTLMIYIALNGVYTVVNCLVLAASGRGTSLLSSIVSLIAMAIGLVALISRPSLSELGVVLAAAQFLSLSILTLFLIKHIHYFDRKSASE